MSRFAEPTTQILGRAIGYSALIAVIVTGSAPTRLPWLSLDPRTTIPSEVGTGSNPGPSMARDRIRDDAQDLFSRGHRAFSSGDYQEAIECFSRAITLRPEVSAGYRYRAYAYLELGDRARALNDLDQAIRLKPDDVQLFADRAAELFTQKAFDQAIADCDR